jgi:ATP adenylyltransferase
MNKTEKKPGCVFCQALSQEDGPENLVVARGRLTFVIMNLYPYTTGHLMILPMAHCATLEDLPSETRFELMEQTTYAMTVLRNVYQPQGFNVGINIGQAAGAGIAEHMHVHVIPRWSGDTNFLSTVGETRMIPESLSESYQRVHQAWFPSVEIPAQPLQVPVTGRKQPDTEHSSDR